VPMFTIKVERSIAPTYKMIGESTKSLHREVTGVAISMKQSTCGNAYKFNQTERHSSMWEQHKKAIGASACSMWEQHKKDFAASASSMCEQHKKDFGQVCNLKQDEVPTQTFKCGTCIQNKR
jgi:fructose-1,6-bisphosphatase